MEHAPSPKPSPHLAIASIPVQGWEPPYDSVTGLRQGTIFPGLVLPFFVTADAFRQAQAQRRELIANYARDFAPLTIDCVCQKHFNWSDGPLPWDNQGGA